MLTRTRFTRSIPMLLVGWLMLPMILSLSGLPPVAQAAASLTFNPVADARVAAVSPNNNFGNSNRLRTSSSPVQTSYLRFVVAGLGAGTLQSATLRIFTVGSSTTGYQVRSVASNTWNETTITYNNRPAVGGLLGNSGAYGSGIYTAVDVTAFVTGNGSYSLALTSSVAKPADYDSRESATQPELVLVFAPAVATRTSTATATLTRVPTATNSATATNIASATNTATSTATNSATATNIASATNTATSTATATQAPTETPLPTATAIQACTLAYPFGPTSLPVSLLGAPYSGSVESVTSDPAAGNYILKVLDKARAAHARVLVSMPGGRQNYQNPDKSFSLALLKEQFNKYSGIDLSSYIADGTLLAAVAIDEPSDVIGNWGGQPVLDSELDAAAQHVKSMFPGIRFIIGTHMNYLQARGYAWQHLSGVMEPFTFRNSPGNDVVAYMDSEVARAKSAGLMIVTNINGPDGGTNGGPLTPAQLLAWGSHAISLNYSSGVNIWSYNTPVWPNGAWFAQSAIAPVLSQLSQLAAARSGCPS